MEGGLQGPRRPRGREDRSLRHDGVLMYDAFQPHKDKFEQWQTDGYPTDNPKTWMFVDNLLHPTQPNALFPHIKRAIIRAVFAYEKLGMRNQLLNVVTGGGKTAAIAAIIAWLKVAHDRKS